MSLKVASKEYFKEIDLTFQNILESISLCELYMNNEILYKSIMISAFINECEELSNE